MCLLRVSEGGISPQFKRGLLTVMLLSRSLRLASLIGAMAVSGIAAADEPKAKADAYEPKARQLLDEVVKTYKSLPAYSDQGELNVVAKVGDKQETNTVRRPVTFARPNKFMIDYEQVRFVSDGKTAFGILPGKKKYAEAPAPEKISDQTVAQMPLPGATGAVMFAGPDGMMIAILLDLLGGDDAAKTILDGTDGLKLEADRMVGDKKLNSLYVDQTRGADIRLLVDPESKWVRRIELVFDLAEMNARLPKDAQLKELTIAWSAGAIKSDVSKDVFAFKPPEGYTKAEAGDAAAAVDQGNPVDELVGKPAPDFTLKVLDPGGKTRSLSKADLAGKVVMIDFWATWCGPCIKELPEVQKMIEAFAKDKKNVVVVALSEDAEPNEPVELRKLIEKTLDDTKLTLIGNPVGMVAIDSEGTIASAYKVEALPTVVIIDAKGIVQAAHVGYNEDVRAVLTKEIETLLSGKSIAKPVEAAEKP
jgi:thiol-disulfide isomerase/thioredoxin/outer membrane lipoprotein-sorting protein